LEASAASRRVLVFRMRKNDRVLAAPPSAQTRIPGAANDVAEKSSDRTPRRAVSGAFLAA